MKKLLWIFFILATAAQAAVPDYAAPFPPALKPEQAQAQAAHLAAELLSRYHYKPVPLDSGLSGKIFDAYLKALDPEKVFFVQADIDQLALDRNKLGAAILKEDLTLPFAIFNLYEQRAAERFDYARTLLKKGFDFQKDESYQLERDHADWSPSDAQVCELWRKRVKNDWLRLKLAGEDDKGITQILDNRYQHFLKRLGQTKSADAFQAYMNAYTMAIEPHTNYMGPRAAEDFDISMKLFLVGIGATLSDQNDYTTIRELVPGGPASLSGQLKVGDRIVGVAQGEHGVMTDIVGWRADDTVALVRGAADTVVRLDVLPADAGLDGKHREVSLVRATIRLQEQAARSSLQLVKDGAGTRRIGVITLPSFYEDSLARQNGAKDYRSATRDVAVLLEGLKKQKIDALLMDLRNDGGGSLNEAVELTGLFVGKGPVLQQRNASGEISVERDAQASVAWDGPLGVLINRESASASEIFTAAIQDYGRGLIMGENSFGKGTVQTMVDLDRVAHNSSAHLGELKMTIAQFFRINGGTTQLRGVKPDISFPAASDSEHFGESSYNNALPWVQIKAADYSRVGRLDELLPVLVTLHENRMRQDRDFQSLQQDITEIKALRQKNMVSLNEAQRRRERDAQEARLASREPKPDEGKIARWENLNKGAASATGLENRDDGLQADERNLANELALEKAQKDAKDLELIEASHVLGDEVDRLKAGDRVASQVRTAAVSVLD